MHYFKSTRYITTLGIMIAALIVLALPTLFIKINDHSIFQITDGVYLAICALMPGWGMLIVGIVYSPMMDVIAGSFIYVPFTIFIHAVMWSVVKLFQIHARTYKTYISLVLGSLLIFTYVLYGYLINSGSDSQNSKAIESLINDSIQCSVSIIVSCLMFYSLSRPNIKKALFNDVYYDQFKKTRNETKTETKIENHKEKIS